MQEKQQTNRTKLLEGEVDVLIKRSDSKVRILKGGETMKKTLGLVLAMVVLVGGSCFAVTTVTASFNVAPTSWTIVALPNVPLDPAVGGQGKDPNGVFGQYTLTNFTCEYWDGGTYQFWNTRNGLNMLLGVGYWVTGTSLASNTVCSYKGVADGVPDSDGNMTDMYISLPGSANQNGSGGWALTGMPFAHIVNCGTTSSAGDKVLFTDGTTVRTWKDAAINSPQWVDGSFLFYQAGSYIAVPNSSSRVMPQLLPTTAYWVHTYKDNLAMIIPAN
jgi:hypothetical protein